MTDLKIDGKPTSGAAQALENHVTRLFDRPGISIMCVVELRSDTRLIPAPGSDKKQAVTVKIVGCEVANLEQEGALREAQRALYLHRTATGKLDEEGEVTLSDETMRMTGGLLNAIETARLRAGLLQWAAFASQVVGSAHKLSGSEMAHEMDAIATGLRALLGAVEREDD